jgi:uncharacterized surface protein with fasciclin (FAS1) repeats
LKKLLHVFIDVSQAFSRIPKPILDQLSIPLNYPLLLSLLRSHFVDNETITSLLSSTLGSGKHPVGPVEVTTKSLEGYPITFTMQPNSSLINNTYYISNIDLTGPIKAANGVVHKITRILDPYASTFGVSLRNGTGTKSMLDTSPRQEEKTMTDLVLAEPQLSVWKDTITEVLPAIMKRLGDRRGAESARCNTPKPFAVLPMNSAFSLLPTGYLETLRAPFNFALSSHLLAWGISVPTCATFEDILAAVRKDGEFKIFSHRADLNLTVTESGRGSGELMVNNARVVMANRCAGNGCIWMVDKMVDPVYGMF